MRAIARRRIGVRYVPIVGHEGYQVGDDGSVWSCWDKRKGGRRIVGFMSDTWYEMHPSIGGGRRNHLFVPLRNAAGSPFIRAVHRLVLEAFVGPCPDGHEACHCNDVGCDNRLSNLYWGTRRANWVDRRRNGHGNRGESNGRSKLSDDAVAQIHQQYGSISPQALAEQLGVSRQTIWAIGTSKTRIIS